MMLLWESNIFYTCLKTRWEEGGNLYKCNLLYIVLYCKKKKNVIDILLNRFQVEYFT